VVDIIQILIQQLDYQAAPKLLESIEEPLKKEGYT
jgi:hypothetical protein